jgi:hypothetical protein
LWFGQQKLGSDPDYIRQSCGSASKNWGLTPVLFGGIVVGLARSGENGAKKKKAHAFFFCWF